MVKGKPAGDTALLVVGLLYRERAFRSEAEHLLTDKFGPVEEISREIPFDFTDYYEREMGAGLMRAWVCFQRAVAPGYLVEAKFATLEMEEKLSTRDTEGNQILRRVNLDPGILTLHNLVLISTKNAAHRVCVYSGGEKSPLSVSFLFAEPTLIFRSGHYRALEWTYPDYRTEGCLEFLLTCRRRLLRFSAEVHR